MKFVLPFSILGALLAGCSSPLQTELFLNGQLEVGLTTCPIGTPCNFQPATLDVQVIDVVPDNYSFRGTLDNGSERFRLEGTEYPRSRDDIAYISPQARGLFGRIEGTLQTSSGATYIMNGTVLYGWGGSPSPGRLSPSGEIVASPGPARANVACPYREIKLELPEQAGPSA